eukprot:gnl/TRDRNA2_/TRDRNA2_190137_c0_seq1.p1 gnl/TRDRNA2_/TRDRNA2_190137_c0~~gnl/TRDRNA2_/TRDRNA2_190137_c0_seq1.p1  ORF type:complete len:542 (+),score=128.26 gnl/TRDRNA2_/TRDRNA2_190137_c0_seq1:108-1628(+)
MRGAGTLGGSSAAPAAAGKGAVGKGAAGKGAWKAAQHAVAPPAPEAIMNYAWAFGDGWLPEGTVIGTGFGGEGKGAGKGGGKKKQKAGKAQQGEGGGADPLDDPIFVAAGTTLRPYAHLEQTWDFEKLQWKVADYFRKAAKDMTFVGSQQQIVDEYADNAFGVMFQAMKDREWLFTVDFTLLFDVAVKALFPEHIILKAGENFEYMLMRTQDRAFDQAKCNLLVWDAVFNHVEGKKAQNKVYHAAEAARAEQVKRLAAEQSNGTAEELDAEVDDGASQDAAAFLRRWVHSTASHLQREQKDSWIGEVLPEKNAAALFEELVQKGALPNSVRSVHEPPLPSPWPPVADAVQAAYQAHPEPAPYVKAKKPGKPRAKTEICWYFMNAHRTGINCSRGLECPFAHGDHEIGMIVGRGGQMLGFEGGHFGKGMKGGKFDKGGGKGKKGGKFGKDSKGSVDPDDLWIPPHLLEPDVVAAADKRAAEEDLEALESELIGGPPEVKRSRANYGR